MGINGEGIGYDHGVPVFIPGALMHETVDVKITQEKEKYKTAKLIRVIRKSKDRVEPECRYCDSCKTHNHRTGKHCCKYFLFHSFSHLFYIVMLKSKDAIRIVVNDF